jgi:hypothetical protein
MSDGWTTVGALAPHDLFEVRGGQRFVRWYGGRTPGTVAANPIDDSSACRHDLSSSLEARPLTPVPVAPALDPTLRGLLVRALETGETGPLFDHLTETNGDRDLADAVRENCARIADGWASQIQKVLPQIRPGHRAEEAVPHWVTVARTIGDSIRHPEKYTD